MDLWEDDLLLDDDFSDEDEAAEEQIEETDLEMDADGFADWEDSSDGAPENQTLEEALAEERTLRKSDSVLAASSKRRKASARISRLSRFSLVGAASSSSSSSSA